MRLSPNTLWIALCLGLLPACSQKPPTPPAETRAETPRLLVKPQEKHQIIDGFGTMAPSALGDEAWLQELYYRDLRASIVRVDLTPVFKDTYADHQYNSPWFHGAPALPGPDDNNARTYRDASDYTRPWAGRRAQIAVMGPDLERNLALLDFEGPWQKSRAALVRRGVELRQELGDFKLVGSVWSPAPWLKRSSGGRMDGHSGVLPKNGTPFPFIWAGNFAGGQLDVSGEPRAEFDDRALGGDGPTSALTQFARGLAATLLGLQRAFGARFYAISIQNELNFETFYNSCTYPRAEQYIAALKAVRRELDRHPELKTIQIMGPEDLLGGDAYSLWQYGSGTDVVHKNLQYLDAIARDPEAFAALSFHAVHGYAPDGMSSPGAEPWLWRAWADGWTKAPQPGLPSTVRGYRHYKKKSWMTETSGEALRWAPDGELKLEETALGLALKLHQALTTGSQSAFLYWELLRDEPHREALTDVTLKERSPKYVAAKHFFRFIRPGSRRIGVRLMPDTSVQASAYVHPQHGHRVAVLLNLESDPRDIDLTVFLDGAELTEAYVSSESSLFLNVTKAAQQSKKLALPARSIATLVAVPPS